MYMLANFACILCLDVDIYIYILLKVINETLRLGNIASLVQKKKKEGWMFINYGAIYTYIYIVLYVILILII